MNPLLPAAAICVGIAVIIFLLGAKRWVLARFERDMAWMRETDSSPPRLLLMTRIFDMAPSKGCVEFDQAYLEVPVWQH